MTVKKWIFQILIGIDQLANTIAGGYADETLSSRAHRMRQKGQTYWRWTAEFIDMLFFWQGPDHCYKAYLKERARKNLPAEYQQHTEQGCQ